MTTNDVKLYERSEFVPTDLAQDQKPLSESEIRTISATTIDATLPPIPALSIYVANVADSVVTVTPGAGNSVRVNAAGTAWEAYATSAGTPVDGSGVANQITYWVDSNTIGALTVTTYPSLTELSYVKGVTSAIQTQFGTKAPTTSPTFATSITGSYLTASQILITDGSKNIVSAAVATYPSLTELTYVKGVTSAIQTQLGTKADSSFKTIAVSGQSDVVADSATDTLTLVAGTGITITTDATTDAVTLTSSGGLTCASGQGSRAAAAGTGNETIAHGLGVTPKLVKIMATRLLGDGTEGQSFGVATTTTSESCQYLDSDISTQHYFIQDAGNIIHMINASTTIIVIGNLTTLDSTNIVINMSTYGNPASSAAMLYQWEAWA